MNEFGFISYALLAVFYALLTLLLIVSWRGRLLGGFLVAACVVSTIWAAVLAWSLYQELSSGFAIFVLEILRGGAWLTFLALMAARIGVNRIILRLAYSLWVGLLSLGIIVVAAPTMLGPDVTLGTILIPGGLAVAMVGLMLIEQLYRNSPPQKRWGLRAIVFGLGGLFAYDLFLYSQGMLFGAIDVTTWTARGAVNCLFVPFIAIAARRNPDWDLNVFVSRQVVFYSTTLVAAGVYLLVMSLGGYALLIYGGTWGGLAQIVFFAGAVLVLIMLLFSSVLRARLKVFLAKHFYRNKYDYREEWLRLVETISKIGERPAKEVAVQAIAHVVESPAGALWVLDESGQDFRPVAAHEIHHELPDIRCDTPLVTFVDEQGWLVDLEEFRDKPSVYGGLVLPEWLSEDPDAWLIIPMFTGRELVGLALLNKAPGPPALNFEDRDLLKMVANHIAVHLAQEKSDIALAEARQFEAYNRLTAFLMHDLNNLIAQQSLIVANAEKHKRNPEFVDDAIQTIANSVDRMKRVMRQLKRGDASKSMRTTDLKFIVSAAVDQCVGQKPVPILDLNGVDVPLQVDKDEFTMVLAHLVRNAQDATTPDGEVRVTLHRDGSDVSIRISDTGTGMPQRFIRERLFRPFDSTKGSQGMGIGAYQAREFVRKLGGDLKVDSEVSRGTTMTILLHLDHQSPT